MQWIATPLLALFAAGPAPPAERYYCSVSRAAPYGTITAYQYVSLEGVPGERATAWMAELAPGGIRINAAWQGNTPAATVDNGFVAIGYRVPEGFGTYRIEIRRAETGPLNQLHFGSGFVSPDQRELSLFTNWSSLTAIAADAPELHVVVVLASGEIVRRDAIDPSVFVPVMVIAAELQPELDTKTAEYRGQCEVADETSS